MSAMGNNNENKQQIGYSSKEQQREGISLPPIASITGSLDLNNGNNSTNNNNNNNNNISLPPLASFGHSFQEIRRPVSTQPQQQQSQSQASSNGGWTLPPIQLAGTSRGLSHGLPSLSSLPFTQGDGQHQHQQQQAQAQAQPQQRYQNNFTQPGQPSVYPFQNQLPNSSLPPMGGYQNQHQFSRPASSLPARSPLATPQQMSPRVQLPSLKDIGVNRPLPQQQHQQQQQQGLGQLPSISRSGSGSVSVHGESRSSSVTNTNNVGGTVFSPRPVQSLNLSTSSSYKNPPNSTSPNVMYASPSASASVVSVASDSFPETSRPLMKENSQPSSRKSSYQSRMNQRKQQRSTSESGSSTPSRSTTLQQHSQTQPNSVKMSVSSSTGSLPISTSAGSPPTNPIANAATPASIINQRKAAVLAGPPRTSRFFRFFSAEAPRQTGVPIFSDSPNSEHYSATGNFKTTNLSHHYNPYIYPQNKNKVNPQPDFINTKKMTTNNGLPAICSPTCAPPIPELHPSLTEFNDPITYLESPEVKSLGEKYGATSVMELV
ncbi:unnamed protein product [Ambrosiozyma monospora]|uniref:Unnamed protein product n=1 Tax=Ambrosiozyma monospora TaxID=43982 RepID=A0ACB5TDU8_AMBMO|nr:unnamed protein product [Ambrosiozyma monospora]